MKRSGKLTAAFVAAIAVLAACGGGEPTEVLPDADGSIRGNVRDNTSAIVANAEVRLSGNAQDARTSSSGADGTYAFDNVRPGTYSLSVTPPAGFNIGVSGTTSVTVPSGQQVNVPSFVLSRIPENAGE